VPVEGCPGAHASLPVRLYQALIRPGTGQQKYQAALSRALGPGFTVIVQGVGIHGVGLYGLVDTSLIRLLTILVAVLAGLGVLNSVLMLTRERVHDLGIFKAVGMTPRRPSSWSPAGSSSPPSLPRSSPCPPG
jgi:putative ABC transport system permease protein